MLVHDIVRRNAQFFGDDPAVVVPGGRSTTWRELDGRTNRLANALLGLGLHQGDRVAMYAPNCSEYLEFYFACAKAGLMGAALNVRLTGGELADYVSYLAPGAVLVHQQLEGPARDWLPLGASDAAVVGIGAGHGFDYDYEMLLARAADTPPAGVVSEDDVYQLAATSGTTGVPKAAMMSHRNAIAAMVNWLSEMPVGEKDVALQCIPHFFNPGGPAHLHPVMMKGGCVVIPASFTPQGFLDLVEEYGVTHAVIVPTMLQMILDAAKGRACDLGSVRGLNTGGSPLSATLLERGRERFGDVFYPIYGMAETFSCATMLRPETQFSSGSEQQVRQLSSVGRPMVLTDVRVVDEAGNDVPADNRSAGEIWLTGDTVATGYLDMPEETAASRSGRWFRTGDVAVVDAERYVTIVDRLKDVIITGGINVFGREVETVLAGHPGVEMAAVIGLPHPRWGEGIHAVVVRRPGAEVSAEELVEHVGSRLAAYKKPQSGEFVAELPLGGTGKVLKRLLRDERTK